jgi:hypothetical protein
MYNMDSTPNMYMKYLKMPVVLALVGSFVYYLIERFDCYINARKTTSLNRRTGIVFSIMFLALYFITMEEKTTHGEIFTDIGNF